MRLDTLLENQLDHWAKFQKLHIYSLSTPRGWKLSLFSLYGHTLSFYPRGLKLSLFLVYGQRSPRYRLIFKIPMFGHETWLLAKVTEVAYTISFYPGVEIELIFASFRDTDRFSKLPYLGMKLGHWPKFKKLHITVNSLMFATDLFGEIRDNLYITKINIRKHNSCVPI